MDDGRVPIPGGSDACPRCPCWFLSCRAMPRLEEITYEAGRSALADQESLVSGIRQRTGTLLAAHAIVASFLGATTSPGSGAAIAGVGGDRGACSRARCRRLHPRAMAVQVRCRFARALHRALRACGGRGRGGHAWLAASAGYGYQELRERNASRVGLMSTLSGALGLLMVLQTLAWLAALAVD